MPRSEAGGRGLKARVLKKIFLGRYINYQISVEDCSPLENQEAIELSQDVSNAAHEFNEGDGMDVTLRAERLNIYDAATGASLIEGGTAQ